MMNAIRWNFFNGLGSESEIKWKSGIVEASSSSWTRDTVGEMVLIRRVGL